MFHYADNNHIWAQIRETSLAFAHYGVPIRI